MKKVALILLAVMILLCSGCSKVGGTLEGALDNALENVLLKKSGIQEDEDYQQYQTLLANGELDEDGAYPESEYFISNNTVRDGTIRVTFATNPYLQVVYCKGEAKTNLIGTDVCYVEPGDTIYYAECVVDNPTTNQYELEGFRVYGYDSDGKRYEDPVCENDEGESNVVCKIPENYIGTELEIVPVGQYIDRSLTLSVYTMDDEGNKTQQSGVGTWSINKENVAPESASVNPVENYTVQYTYEMEHYFFVESTPEAYYVNKEKGTVTFSESNALVGITDYIVELHNYLDVKIQLDEKGTVSYNGNDEEDLKKNKEWTRSDLEYNDKIVVETAGELTVFGEDADHVVMQEASLGSGITRYTLTLSRAYNSDGDYIHVIFNTQDEYGICEFRYGEKDVSGYTDVKVGDIVKLTYTLTNKDYEFMESGNFLVNLIQGNKRTVAITVTKEMADRTINRDDYIKIVRKES